MSSIDIDIGITEQFDGSRLSHAYVASTAIADSLAMAVVCSGLGRRPCMNCAHCEKSKRGIHPDITVVEKFKGKQEIVVGQIRGLVSDAIIFPNESDKKAYVINDADLMNLESQNAFLRTLEEPPSHAVYILKTDSPDALLPTIRSRCIELRRKLIREPDDPAIAELSSQFLLAIKKGNAALAAFMFQLEKLSKDEFSAFLITALEEASAGLRVALSAQNADTADNTAELYSRIQRVLLRSGDYLNLNVSIGHVSGLICATLMNDESRQ